MQPDLFFNTTHLTSSALKIAYQQSLKSNEAVKLVFEKYHQELTSAEVYNILQESGYKFPITSCRRAITGLCATGLLEDTGKLKEGNFGSPNIVWRLKSNHS